MNKLQCFVNQFIKLTNVTKIGGHLMLAFSIANVKAYLGSAKKWQP